MFQTAKDNMNTYWKIIFAAAAFLLVFYAGMAFQNYLTEDRCLDLGGGRNPGNYPVCVLNR